MEQSRERVSSEKPSVKSSTAKQGVSPQRSSFQMGPNATLEDSRSVLNTSRAGRGACIYVLPSSSSKVDVKLCKVCDRGLYFL